MFAAGEGEPLLVTPRLLGWECCLEPMPRAPWQAGVLSGDLESLWQHRGMGEMGSCPGRPRRPLGSGRQPCSPQEVSSAGLELHSRADSAAPPEESAARPALQLELFFQ